MLRKFTATERFMEHRPCGRGVGLERALAVMAPEMDRAFLQAVLNKLLRGSNPAHKCALLGAVARDHLPKDHVAHIRGVRPGLPPHLFRDCLATSLAINDPGIVNIAHVLFVNSPATTERFYDLAQTLEAGRLVGDTLARLRGKLQAA